MDDSNDELKAQASAAVFVHQQKVRQLKGIHAAYMACVNEGDGLPSVLNRSRTLLSEHGNVKATRDATKGKDAAIYVTKEEDTLKELKWFASMRSAEFILYFREHAESLITSILQLQHARIGLQPISEATFFGDPVQLFLEEMKGWLSGKFASFDWDAKHRSQLRKRVKYLQFLETERTFEGENMQDLLALMTTTLIQAEAVLERKINSIRVREEIVKIVSTSRSLIYHTITFLSLVLNSGEYDFKFSVWGASRYFTFCFDRELCPVRISLKIQFRLLSLLLC